MPKYYKNSLKLIAFTIALLFSMSIFASEKQILDKRFKGYWSSFSVGDFNSTSKFIYAKDMELLKTAFVPIFLNAAKSPNPNIKKQADIYFGEISTDLRSAFSAKDAFIGANRIGFASNSDLLALMKNSKISINKIQFISSNEALIQYTVTFSNGYKGDDQEHFIKVDGIWFLRLKQIVENAEKMKAILTQ